MQLILSDYTVEFGSANAILKNYLKERNYSKILVLTDENTFAYCLPQIQDYLPEYDVIKIASGENHKNLETCNYIWGEMLKYNTDRHSLMINLGGGVIGDMGGFVASTYMRGIDFIQMPSTLLSQVDASVGGKLGVDYNGLKNFIGVFNNPKSVVVDSGFLSTLPEEQIKSGYAEMVKHALIKDSKMWKRFISADHWKYNIVNAELKESVKIKKQVVEEDPREKGLRKILNFGHTLGHAIETYSFTTRHPLLHGHAIALGMIGEAYLSHKLMKLSSEDLKEIKDYIHTVYTFEPQHYHNLDSIIENMKYDKKNRSGNIRFSLLNGIGECSFDVEVDKSLISESLEYTLNS